MSRYQLAPDPLADPQAILVDLSEHQGVERADDVEDKLRTAFRRLAMIPGLGHRRRDITRRPYFFYFSEPSHIVYMREVDPLPIFAVLHASRDIRSTLLRRGR